MGGCLPDLLVARAVFRMQSPNTNADDGNVNAKEQPEPGSGTGSAPALPNASNGGQTKATEADSSAPPALPVPEDTGAQKQGKSNASVSMR